jgi:hypothetical protein
MKSLVRVGVMLLPLLFMSAVCVSNVRQESPTGPWIGEVTNFGSEPAYAFASGRLYDASGRILGGYFMVRTCPAVVMPGGQAAFEVFPLNIAPDATHVAPFRFVPDLANRTVPSTDGVVASPGLSSRVVTSDATRGFAVVEIRNTSDFTYHDVTVCANLRSPSGVIEEIASSIPFPDTMRPGDARTFPMFFNSLPMGTFEIYPRGDSGCCVRVVPIVGNNFSVTAVQIVENGQALRVVGELRNDTIYDLLGVAISAHVDGSWSNRVDKKYLTCSSWVGSGMSIPETFTLPLASGRRNPAAAIEGVGGEIAKGYFALSVSDVTSVGAAPSASGLPTRRVTAKVTNPTANMISVEGACLALRDAGGRLVGAAPSPHYRDLAPGATAQLAADVEELAPSTSAEMTAYGRIPPQIIGVDAR